jgi:hypothetical protein
VKNTVFCVVRRQPDASREYIASIFRIEMEASLSPASAGFLLGILFNPEDEDDVFLRNVGLSPNYNILQLRRQYSSGVM